jgi:signal transduction histidine kinase
LRPAILDLGVVPAIEWQTQEFQKRTGINCKFLSQIEQIEMDRNHATAMFRILQETLTNVVRHANASEVEIKLEAENGALRLQVKDNGRGISDSEMTGGKSLGLLGMRERAVILGGKVDIEGLPNQGTTVSIFIPLTA